MGAIGQELIRQINPDKVYDGMSDLEKLSFFVVGMIYGFLSLVIAGQEYFKLLENKDVP
jgi:hypothetical protein